MITRFSSEAAFRAKQHLTPGTNIVIVSHERSDGDAVGSSLGIYHYLKQKVKNVTVVLPDDPPGYLAWLPDYYKIVIHQINEEKAVAAFQSADVIFCLDFNSPKRIGKLNETLQNSKAIKINIDHHLEPEDIFDYTFCDPKAAATAELVYEFIIACGDKPLINKAIAECLYTGIMTDTGSFRFSSTKASTHRIIANLVETGAENFRIHERVFDNFSEARIRLIGYSLCEKLTVLPQYRTAFIALSAHDLKKFGYRDGDTEGLVNYPLSISETVMSVLFTERDGQVNISFRSKGNFSVRDLAFDHFNGGGHTNAAGGRTKISIEETVEKFINLLPSYQEKLHETKI